MKSAPRVSLISLGCAKNQVDSERMLGALSANGYDLVEDPAASDLVIVNTCGFIESAKAESIDTILEAAQLTGDTGGGEPKKLVVAGCLVERYLDELKSELEHEVDVFVTLSEEQRIVAACDDALGVVRGTTTEWEGRHLISPSHWAYLKIAEGCDHTCSFCAIPSIRGKHNSVPMEALEEEAARLAQGGVKELNLVAQDTTLYGADIYDRKSLPKLLERLNEVDGIMWLRLFYAHPANVSDDLIDA
ncbi:MAG: radical SAM protein, partial [Candidatus Latescibacteria bacterium]|nr:radical SAM protein [Candidatus Latescibacterota bacterium]